MSFDLPRHRVVPVEAIDVRVDPAPHPFEVANAAAIAAHWQKERAAQPALFDGRIMLLSSLHYGDGRLEGRCHEVGYSTFLYWRRERPPGAEHTFAHAALVAADGALVAIRMGPHTANPGAVYFAAGSFEPQDFPGGAVDVHANVVREVREETGLDISGVPCDRRWHLLSLDHATVLFRRYRLAEDGETIAARVRAFVAADSDPEIDGPVLIRPGEPLPERLRPHMRPLIEWHFSGAE